MAFSTLPYCTSQQVVSALDPGSTSLPTDTWIEELILEAQGMIDQEIGYPFQTDGTVSLPASRVYDGNDGNTLLIDKCVSISQVQETTYTSSMNGAGVWMLGTPSIQDITADCVLGPNNNIPNFGYGFTLKRISGIPFHSGTQNYTVKGVFGRSFIPPEISRACVRLAVHYYKMRDTAYADQVIEQGMVRVKYRKAIPEDVMEIISQYKPQIFIART